MNLERAGVVLGIMVLWLGVILQLYWPVSRLKRDLDLEHQVLVL